MPHEESKGGQCPLRPQFEEYTESASGSQPRARKVRLSTRRYVQLLVDARETDPDCWPPGLERAASLLEEARAIEEACVSRRGDFAPEKLSRAQSRRYFEIQLTLDAIQEEAEDTPLDIEGALSEARHALDEHEGEVPGHKPTALPPAPRATLPLAGAALPLSQGFFASAGTFIEASIEEHLTSGADAASESAAPTNLALEKGWGEIPPLHRGDNYA